MDEPFSDWLRRQRNERRLSRTEFAQRVGCSAALLRKIEDGERHPSAQIAGLIANALEIPAAQRETFIRIARGEWGADRLKDISKPLQNTDISRPGDFSRNFPALPTPLIGREPELEELQRFLGDPDCRLLTLVGQGGIGKTRLATEAAARVQAEFADGAYFVALGPVKSARSIAPVIADSIGFTFKSLTKEEPQQQLLAYLEGKCMLLLLDNIEHLLQGPEVELLAQLLGRAPKVKLLVTSREPVNLQGEWVVEVQGLPIPEDETLQGTAIELFLQRARRARVSFNATVDDYRWIIQVCRLVDGIPLGIELAAAWVQSLSCAEIAREIERGLDFLHASARDVPARHRSMGALFDHSWQLLSEEEQSVLSRLSVFQGGFSREAAQQVAGANLAVLSSLIAKSLLWRTGDRRYDLHEVIKQYAADRLAGQPAVQRKTRERHARYFMEYFARQDLRLRSFEQQDAIEELAGEMGNFRAAWSWSVGRDEFDRIQRSVRALETFFDVRGWFHEGLDYFEQALETLEESGRVQPVARARLLIGQSLLLFRLSRMEAAREKLEHSITILRPLGRPDILVEAVSFLGIVCAMMGRYAEGLELFHEGLDLANACEDAWFRALTLTEIISVELMMGTVENAYERFQRALDAWRVTGDPRFTAFALNALSLSAARLGRLNEARSALMECIAINRSVGDRWGLGTAQRGLGLIEQQQGRHKEAIDAFQESRTTLQDLGARWDIARVLGDMGRSLLALGKPAEAENVWREAIWIASEVQGTPLILESVLGIANVRAGQGSYVEAYTLLQSVVKHPASVQETRSRAAQSLGEFMARFTVEEIASIRKASVEKPFDEIVSELLGSVSNN